MNDYLNAHTWLCCTTFWNLAKLTFVLMCGLGSLGFLIYCGAVVIGSFVEAQQDRSTWHSVK